MSEEMQEAEAEIEAENYFEAYIEQSSKLEEANALIEFLRARLAGVNGQLRKVMIAQSNEREIMQDLENRLSEYEDLSEVEKSKAVKPATKKAAASRTKKKP